MEEALKATGLQKDELAMVGDRLYTDIATGRNFGILSILVLTGEATLQDVEASDVKPDLIFDRLSSMNPYLRGSDPCTPHRAHRARGSSWDMQAWP